MTILVGVLENKQQQRQKQSEMRGLSTPLRSGRDDGFLDGELGLHDAFQA